MALWQLTLFIMLYMPFMLCHGSTMAFDQRNPRNTYNVEDFGAKGDGREDASKAFLMAWQKACSSGGTVLVPSKTYLLNPVELVGPCKSPIAVKITGTLLASEDRAVYRANHWIYFANVQGLLVEGPGLINGNGNVWWKKSCKVDKSLPCTDAPTAVTFNQCDNLTVTGINTQDAQKIHITFAHCNNVHASSLTVTAPGNSPNTDGIHITRTANITVQDTTIGTGDDCISIETGSSNVGATNITCGPGHGISIGSLGDDNSEAHVTRVHVVGANIVGATNGVRIKTYQGGSGSANHILFQDINMNNVSNPIIIDQYYCDKGSKSCAEQSTAVQVQDVLYKNIKGTSASEVAIKLNCSKNHPCQEIRLDNVQLGYGQKAAKAVCSNVNTQTVGNVNPRCT